MEGGGVFANQKDHKIFRLSVMGNGFLSRRQAKRFRPSSPLKLSISDLFGVEDNIPLKVHSGSDHLRRVCDGNFVLLSYRQNDGVRLVVIAHCPDLPDTPIRNTCANRSEGWRVGCQ